MKRIIKTVSPIAKQSTFFLLLAFVVFFTSGCKTRTIYVPVKQSSSEIMTLRDTIIETDIKYYRDTIVTPDTLSFLSNPYGFSWAEAKDGKLHHSLSSWPDSVVPVKLQYKEITRVDTIPVPYTVEVPVYKEKALSKWDKIRIKTGELSILLIALFILVRIIIKKRG